MASALHRGPRHGPPGHVPRPGPKDERRGEPSPLCVSLQGIERRIDFVFGGYRHPAAHDVGSKSVNPESKKPSMGAATALLFLGAALLFGLFGSVDIGQIHFSPISRLPAFGQALFACFGSLLILLFIWTLLERQSLLSRRESRFLVSTFGVVALAVGWGAWSQTEELSSEVSPITRWEVRPPGHVYLEMNTATLLRYAPESRVVAACRVADPKLDPVTDPTIVP